MRRNTDDTAVSSAHYISSFTTGADWFLETPAHAKDVFRIGATDVFGWGGIVIKDRLETAEHRPVQGNPNFSVRC